ncbi:MAG: methyl-accepting chemotaxis protein [Clostridium sp.]|nr:methyl-accepting chemotaxis protein [Clostridium sp.]
MNSNKHKFISIRYKLSAIMILICMIPIILLGTVSYYKSYDILNEKLHTTTQQTLHEVNTGIDNYLVSLSSDTTLLSNDYDIQNYISHPEFKQYAMSLMQEIKNSNSSIIDCFYGDTNKTTLIYPEENLPAGFDPTSRPWYKQALEKKGQVAFSPVYKDAVTGKTIISISRAVYNNNTIVGVVGIDVDLNSLSTKLSHSKVGNTGDIFLTSSNGTMIANKDKTLIGNNKIKGTSIWSTVTSKPSGFAKIKFNGKSIFISYDTNKISGWKLIAQMDEKELLNDTNSIKYLTLAFIIIMAIFASLIANFISKFLSKHIKKLEDAFEKASGGDFSVSVNISSNDEFELLGNNCNSMFKEIKGLVSKIKNSAETITDASVSIKKMSSETDHATGDVATAIDQLAQGATSQSENISKSADAFEHLSSKIDNIKKLTENINKISKNTKEFTNEGSKIMTILTEKTNSVDTSTKKVSSVINEMTESTKQIGVITDTIDSISEQTNLLALNAAIEAARAGEAGKGFSVVAEEIRQLAEQSTNSTTEIQKLIETIKSRTEDAAISIASSTGIVEDQSQSVVQTKDIFEKISKSLNELVAGISSIDTAIINTKENKDDISEKIQNISAIAEESSASTEEISATMDEFNSSAENLKEVVEKLDIEIAKFKLE